jgi:aspartate racemase
MHIGLIGGIGPAATDFYYRRLIAAFADRRKPLELTIVHADAPTLLRHLAADDRAGQVAIYERVTARLAAAGAECCVVTSMAGHFCIAEFEAVSPLPVINILSAVNRAVRERGLTRVGILGTRTVMASRGYGQLSAAEIIPPPGSDLDAVHEAYVTMAASGLVTEAQRAVFDTAARRMMNDAHAEAIMLGGTDLALVYREADAPFPLVDCAGIHVDAIVALATGESGPASRN